MKRSDIEKRLPELFNHSLGGVGIALLGVFLVSTSFMLQADRFIDFADEGYLWYGTWRASLGEVPIRDFQSYDPGRYYWGAFWFQFLGDGIIALRTSNAIFQCVGLIFGLLILRRLSGRLDFLFVSGLILLVWTHPRHKVFDISIALAVTHVAVCLIEKPSLARHFISGLFVGVAAFLGGNHGIYSCLALGMTILFSRLRFGGPSWAGRGFGFGTGIVVGFSPMLLMALFVPGFLESAIERVAIMLDRGSTNLSLSIPWPWTVWGTTPPAYLEALGLGSISGFIVGSFYLIWIAFLVAVGLYALRNREPLTAARTVLFAAAFVSLPYFHHASTRAGITHLSQAIHPLLIGLIAMAYLLSNQRRRYVIPMTLITIGILSAGSIAILSPLTRSLTAKKSFLTWASVGEDTIQLRKDVAAAVRAAETISRQYMAPDEDIFIAPRLPAYYSIMRRKSPIYETYFAVVGSQQKQDRIRNQLEAKNVTWAIIGNEKLDNREDLRFRNSHSNLWQYIEENFEPVDLKDIRRDYTLLKRRTADR